MSVLLFRKTENQVERHMYVIESVVLNVEEVMELRRDQSKTIPATLDDGKRHIIHRIHNLIFHIT